MPRQLPWLNNGGGGGTQRKQQSRPAKKQRVASDIDDDFFDGTVLAGRKGKERAVDSDDDLPVKATFPSFTRKLSDDREAARNERLPSSSPPPIAYLEEHPVEYMRKGTSKFDLRDDEWMMVEDEFLETAKLFTRHLHIAEYENLKQRIEEKKKEAEVARPVVAGAKLSEEGALKEKANIQEKKQKKAIREVFASSQLETAEDEVSSMGPPPTKLWQSFTTSSTHSLSKLPKQPSLPSTAADSDSDDLDTPQRPVRPRAIARPSASTSLPPPRQLPAKSKSFAAPPAPTKGPAAAIAKPTATPLAATKSRSRISRATPFDMLDDYVPRPSQTATSRPAASPRVSLSTQPSSKIPQQSLSPVKRNSAAAVSEDSKPRRSSGDFDDWGSRRTSKETSDRLETREADREKDGGRGKDTEQKKKAAVKLDDIPTFLF